MAAEVQTLINSLESLKIDSVNGRVLNPKTKRWVKTTGKIGRELISNASKPWDIEKWIQHGGYELAPGESVQVKGSEDNIYIVKRSQKIPTSVYCSCPAWKYQRLNPLLRTCKHCQAVCGASAEATRIANNK